MDIRTYVFEKQLTMRKLAKMLDISPAYLSQIKKGTVIPSRKITERLREVSGGLVDIPSSNDIRRAQKAIEPSQYV